jgi:arylsulfatase A-like enzyme
MSGTATKPNIVFILTDDQAGWALGCAGNSEIRTPHLDRLAAGGIRFDHFFCATPVCSPSRATYLTGRMPSQHGIHDFLANEKNDPVEYLQGLKGYTDILAENGYVCGITGKWHLGDSHKTQKSFSHWHVRVGGGGYFKSAFNKNGKVYQTDRYITEVITDDALEFIEARHGAPEPFYLSVHYTAPHGPWVDNHPQEYTDLYRDCPFESCPQEPEHPWSLPSTVPKDVRTNTRVNLAGYFAAVTAMDHGVGQIVAKLEQLSLRDNTLIVFASDNGFNCGHHGVWGKGNGTFPQNMYDSSIKVPLIASHPGVVPKGEVCSGMFSAYDLMPTLLDYTGLANPGAGKLPGRSFVPVLRGEAAGGNDHIVVYDEYGPTRMIRTREYKYVHRYPYGPHELYDLQQDPQERRNLLLEDGGEELVVPLKAKLEEWFVRYSDPAVDGRHEAVTGKGQLGLAGPAGKGAKAFSHKY